MKIKIFCQHKNSKIKSKKERLFTQRLIAEKKAKELIYLSRCRRGVLDVIISFNTTYKNTNVNLKQATIAKKVDCRRETVCRCIAFLTVNGFIEKTPRGWKVIKVPKNIFISKPCNYKIPNKLKKIAKYLLKYLPKFHPLWKKLYERIPALRRYITSIVTLIFIYLNTGYLINNNNSIQSKELTIFGQNDYEISKKYEEEEIFPTSTLSVPQYRMPVDHPFNTYEEHYPYNKCNIQSRVKLMVKDKMMNNIDLRFCSEADYKKLDYEDKKIASDYCNGKKLYGSTQLYEQSLHERNLSSKIWKPRFPIVNMAADKLKLIQKFPEVVKQDCRYILKKFPNEAKNYNWIFDCCLTRCKMRNLSTREILKRNGFPEIRVKPEDNIKPKATQINDNFRRLIGDEAFNAYMNKINPPNKEKDI